MALAAAFGGAAALFAARGGAGAPARRVAALTVTGELVDEETDTKGVVIEVSNLAAKARKRERLRKILGAPRRVVRRIVSRKGLDQEISDAAVELAGDDCLIETPVECAEVLLGRARARGAAREQRRRQPTRQHDEV